MSANMPPPPAFINSSEKNAWGPRVHRAILLICTIISIAVLVIVGHFMEVFKETALSEKGRKAPKSIQAKPAGKTKAPARR